MQIFSRTDTSLLARWWWTVDRMLLGVIVGLAFFGCLLVAAASPAVAESKNLSSFHFVNLHLVYLAMTLIGMIILSMFSEVWLRRMAMAGLLGSIGLMIMTLLMGFEAKGATRWIDLGFISLQPSEFMKPCLAVVSAWLIARQMEGLARRNYHILFGFVACIGLLLYLQPDMGMLGVTLMMLGSQVFMAGLPLILVGVLVAFGLGVAAFAYLTLPHFYDRFNRFLNSETADTYQIDRSLESFANGGLFGVGPGEGTVKMLLPDAHADFIFAVSGEEMGLIWTLILVVLFMTIIYRTMARAFNADNLFVVLALSGLVCIFGFQTLIHMMSSLHMMPTKGMTLPLISYGGSSLLSTGILLGFILGFTRKKPSFKGVKSMRPVANAPWTGAVPLSGKVR